MQLRDLDLAAGTVTVRSGKAGKARRVPLHASALVLLQRYLTTVRCPSESLAIGSSEEREPLLGRLMMTAGHRPLRPGITRRVVQRVVARLSAAAASRLETEAARETRLDTATQLREWAGQSRRATPHTPRHSLARRLLASGANLPEVQRVLGHGRLSTTGIYLAPSEDDLRLAVGRAGV